MSIVFEPGEGKRLSVVGLRFTEFSALVLASVNGGAGGTLLAELAR